MEDLAISVFTLTDSEMLKPVRLHEILLLLQCCSNTWVIPLYHLVVLSTFQAHHLSLAMQWSLDQWKSGNPSSKVGSKQVKALSCSAHCFGWSKGLSLSVSIKPNSLHFWDYAVNEVKSPKRLILCLLLIFQKPFIHLSIYLFFLGQ